MKDVQIYTFKDNFSFIYETYKQTNVRNWRKGVLEAIKVSYKNLSHISKNNWFQESLLPEINELNEDELIQWAHQNIKDHVRNDANYS